MRFVLSVAVLMVVLAAEAEDAGRRTEPSPRPISWELDLAFLDPQRIEVQLPGVDRPEVYWYLVYTVTNNTGQTRQFFPTFEIVTEDLKVHSTDVGISPLVFDAIHERHRLTHKYLAHPTKAIGPLLTGADNARESVAIWRNIDINVNQFRVYVSGLSGEKQLVRNPSYDPDRPENEPIGRLVDGADAATANPRFFTLRKTLEVRYTLAGSPVARPVVEPQREGVRWIMR